MKIIIKNEFLKDSMDSNEILALHDIKRTLFACSTQEQIEAECKAFSKLYKEIAIDITMHYHTALSGPVTALAAVASFTLKSCPSFFIDSLIVQF